MMGPQLREARKRKGISLRRVEQLTGLSNAYVCQVETGHIKEPSFRKVLLLCKVYEIDPMTLELS